MKSYAKHNKLIRVVVAVLYSTRYDNPKGTRIGPRYLHIKTIKQA